MALTDQLLNHFKEKFGIVTVVNATFYAVDGDEPLISFDTLKMSNITSEGQQKEIRGGQGAELLLQYDFGRTASIEITDALVSMGSLEYLFGGTASAVGSVFTALRRVEGVIATTNTFAAPGDRKASTYNKLIVILPDGTKEEIEGASNGATVIDSSQLAALDYDVLAGSKYIYFYTAEVTAAENKKEIVLKATDFPPTVRMVGETIVLDADKGQKIAFQIEIPKMKLNANFTLSLDAEGDPSVFDFGGVALSHNGDLIKVRTLGVVAGGV